MDSDEFLAARAAQPGQPGLADELFRLALPDAWIVSGCLVQTVWNVLTGRAVDYGIDDYDVFYFDSDTSLAGRGRGDPQAAGRLCKLGVKIEARNQARVHLWYPQQARPALSAAAIARPQGIDRFLTRNTQVGIRRTPGRLRRLCAERL